MSELSWLAKVLGLEIEYSGHLTHAYLHLPDGRCYLLPINNCRVFQRGLEVYPAQGKRGRIGKKVLKVFSWFGLKGPGMARISLKENFSSVTYHLREVFQRNDVCFAISLGLPGPHRKPVIQVLTLDGDILGYAKLGWNEITKKLVENDALMNRKVRSMNIQGLVVPNIINFSNTHRGTILVTSPLEGFNSTKWNSRFVNNFIKVMAAVAIETRIDRVFIDSPFWKNLNEKLFKLAGYLHIDQFTVLNCALSILENRLGKLELPWVFTLGDTTRWNMAIDRSNGMLMVVDLEYSKDEWLLGWDLFRFYMQDYSPISKAAVSRYYSLLGVDTNLTNFFQLAFWVDLYTEWYLAWKNANLKVSPAADAIFRKIIEVIRLLTTYLEVKKQ